MVILSQKADAAASFPNEDPKFCDGAPTFTDVDPFPIDVTPKPDNVDPIGDDVGRNCCFKGANSEGIDSIPFGQPINLGQYNEKGLLQNKIYL